MNRYHYRSLTGWLFGLAFKVLASAIGLALVATIIEPLLIHIAGIAIIVMVATVWVRWRLFRHRGW